MLAGGGLTLAGAWGAQASRCAPRPLPGLASEGVALGPGGVLVPLPVGARCRYVAGTRVPAWVSLPEGLEGLVRLPSEQEADRLIAQARERRAAAVVPPGRWHALAHSAPSDLLALTGARLATSHGGPGGQADVDRFAPGAVVSAPVSYWRYVWTRDASFAAAAYGAVGLFDESRQVLSHLARLQEGLGSGTWRAGQHEVRRPLEARYTADGGVPDDRAAQLDGVGWLLWAAGRLADDLEASGRDPEEVRSFLAPVEAVAARSASHLMWLTPGPGYLPPASPDYWEVSETRLTLGTAAPVLLGLEAAARLCSLGLDLQVGPDVLQARVGQVREAMTRAFAPHWGRHEGRDDVDAALTLVLPPFTQALDGALEVRRQAWQRMQRPAGGVAPGSSWRQDGISWTPQTALLAWSGLAQAQRDPQLGREGEILLDWLEGHRTSVGALPEKVRADGRPAGPAPLAWTCALVLLAVTQARGRSA